MVESHVKLSYSCEYYAAFTHCRALYAVVVMVFVTNIGIVQIASNRVLNCSLLSVPSHRSERQILIIT